MVRVAAVAGALVLAVPASGEIATEMTPARIAAAVATGQSRRIEPYRLKGGAGPDGRKADAYFTTPYLRVALAASDAKLEYRAFAASDVTGEMTAPEIEVRAAAFVQPPRLIRSVRHVVVTGANGRDPVQPLSVSREREQFANLLGASAEGQTIRARFPLAVVSVNAEVHVIYEDGEDVQLRFGDLSGIR